MNFGRRFPVSTLGGFAAAAMGLLVSGCVGTAGLRPPGDPPVITETGTVGPAAEPAAARAALLAEMRAAAEASAAQPHTQAGLAARPEPKSVAEVEAIEAELELIGQQRAASANPREIAALEARARELRRLVAAAQAGTARR
jgi:hypothetical protein